MRKVREGGRRGLTGFNDGNWCEVEKGCFFGGKRTFFWDISKISLIKISMFKTHYPNMTFYPIFKFL